jgi:ATP-dependent Clp protease ATP-binding subunit ClpA
MSDRTEDDIFLMSGRLRPDVTDDATAMALRESLCHAQVTNWESIRTPHLFMGVLSVPDPRVRRWAGRLNADIGKLQEQFRDLFYQEAKPVPPLQLNREFLSDNAIRLLREAWALAKESGRDYLTQMDLLVTFFSTENSIVAECFERIGVEPARLAELAEQER